MTGADELQVVFVCTGNRFRSPLAAALFREATSGLPVDVRSMGTSVTGSDLIQERSTKVAASGWISPATAHLR